jgi:hypothetical protein
MMMQTELFPELEKPTDTPDVAGCPAMPCCASQFGRVLNGHRLVRVNHLPEYGILREIRGTEAGIVPFQGNHAVWPTVKKSLTMDVHELASRQPVEWYRHNT